MNHQSTYQDQSLQVRIGNYVYQQIQTHIIGKGTFADVYKGYDLKNKQIVAIKVIDLNGIKSNNKTFESLNREKAILKKISGPNIVQLIDIIEQEKKLYIITEFCNNGDLEKYIQKYDDPMSQEECIRILKNFVEGYKVL